MIVVGGGLIGTAIAWRLGQAGLRVTILCGERSAAASNVAAGMLAPVTETTFTESALLGLSLASRERYDGFATELEAATELPSGLRRQPTLSVATSADDDARLRVLADYLARLDLVFTRLGSRECRRAEPLLAPGVRSGLLVEGDWSCDNRLLWRALRTAATQAGVEEVATFAHRIESAARSGHRRRRWPTGPRSRHRSGGAGQRRLGGADHRHRPGAGPAGQGPDPAPRSGPAALARG